MTSDLSSNGGLLTPAQANAFLDMAMTDTVLMNEARFERMNSPKQRIEKIGFSSRIMGPAVEATDPGTDSDPDTDMVELSTVEGIAVVKISYSSLEDNIERGRLADRIVRLIAQRAGVDLEEQFVNGDTASGDSWLAQNDGFLKLATSHVVAHTDLTSASDVIEVMDKARAALPKKYLRNKREWRLYVHEDVEYQLRTALSERATAGGDRFLLDDAPVVIRGIPVVALPAIAEYDDSGTTRSDALLIHPQNAVIGIQRHIQVESDRKIRARVVEYVCSVRSDVEYEEEDAVVKVTGIEHA